MSDSPYTLTSYGISDIGLVRRKNEDVWSSLPHHQFYIIADGMGGHKGGDIAAKEAVETLCSRVEDLFEIPHVHHRSVELFSDTIEEAIIHANATVYSMAERHTHLNGMGTTLCCFLLYQGTLIYGHVGDSRLYLMRDKLTQLTKDHSLFFELLSKGALTKKEAANFPYKNVITRAIGTSPHVHPEVGTTLVLPGDIYFLCSDGLTDLVSDAEIQAILLSSHHNIEEAANHLVTAAIAKGGKDNITVLITKVESVV